MIRLAFVCCHCRRDCDFEHKNIRLNHIFIRLQRLVRMANDVMDSVWYFMRKFGIRIYVMLCTHFRWELIRMFFSSKFHLIFIFFTFSIKQIVKIPKCFLQLWIPLLQSMFMTELSNGQSSPGLQRVKDSPICRSLPRHFKLAANTPASAMSYYKISKDKLYVAKSISLVCQVAYAHVAEIFLTNLYK